MVNIPKQYILPPPQYRHNIIINIAELRLYYFAEDGYTVMTFPIALGKAGWRTPLAKTYIARKQDAPDWNVPKSIQAHALATKGKVLPDVVPPGPENPLGDYALYLGLNGYLIHGNNNPYSIGNLVSSGCIRLHNDDVDKLFWQVSVGTPVRIIYYPVKAGWLNDQLYLESHREISHEQGVYAASTLPVSMIIHNALSGKIADINWHVVSMVTSQRTGIPRVIGSEW
jgi:L,D-transpeptidase ErfK/SrfK